MGRSARWLGSRGKVVVLSFSTSPCEGCEREAPRLEKDLWQKLRGRGLAVLGVHTGGRDTPLQARQFQDEHHLTYPLLVDTGSRAAQAFRVPGYPTCFVIDRAGKIRSVVVGSDLETLEGEVRAALNARR